jgi:hypothetical protein
MKAQTIRRAMIIFVTLILSACTTAPQVTPDIPMLTAPAGTGVMQDTLSLTSFNNAEIYCPQAQKTVQLTNGKYEGGTGADYLLAQLMPQAAFGDINEDGREDAVLLLAENMGGSGTFVSLIAMIATDSGFSQSTAVLVDDRPLINALTLDGSRIVLDAVIHGVSDAMADPTMKVVEQYAYANQSLVLTRFDSTISDTARSITIDTPTAGQEVTGPVEVKGSMPIAPFENTLMYTIYDETNTVIDQGAFMVTAADMGAPATFDNQITLPAAASGTKLRIELKEVSMADGSTLCLNSVEVVVK